MALRIIWPVAAKVAKDDIPDFGYFDILDLDTEHKNAYLYSSLNFIKNVTLTLDVSGDKFKTQDMGLESKNQINPKFGITWNILPTTALRAAAFRVFKRPLVTNIWLVPTFL